ncbi:TPA: DUF2290 domain-containing protein [Pseudomonas aeruginosa]|nr:MULTISPECIES: DUF2290 domain-containing protein [Pseudomonas]HCL2752753.1 DUF2290 domain-containing protein [Pseudomonas aeruginosa 449A]EKL0658761.1 DUF2290 domain-containing protein [Pseudomonas aeruginosa]EKP5712765.1 DUF2290 domain-containing protein [Pseudomonas aeruginosa]EKU3774092.1 DUF2290 domain-containing protein [Pseudomonas aeruginosa]EKU4551318.1 DUF2290 domain-containing protein [Pseudomonas aeruginosa]
MNFAQACQGVRNVLNRMQGVTQVDNILLNEAEKYISWSGRRPGILKGVYYPLEYQSLLDRQDYSILLSDGSFFQFYYSFDLEGGLSKARLAYYPRPLETMDSLDDLYAAADEALDREDDDLYEYLYNWTEVMEFKGVKPSNTSHIRFDYDRGVAAHCESHIQFSGVNSLRVGADFFPLPMAFVKFCESLVSDGQSLVSEDQLGFEKNNFLRINSPGLIISLRHL